jgi:hypothetical protein
MNEIFHFAQISQIPNRQILWMEKQNAEKQKAEKQKAEQQNGILNYIIGREQMEPFNEKRANNI